MYETVLFSGFGSLTLALVLGHLKKEKLFVYMGLGYNVCTLMMLNFANGMLSATISPLVPVLRDNFWLSTHVTCVILSYGALALSWILANSVLIKRKWGKITKKEELYYADVIYTTLKWGTTMLAAGVILGGVWADYSWGRFWGWDPKETWSLIVLFVYMAILHGRYTSWIKPARFITITAGAFLSVMMAWFGVNYILATGLHSYGFSEGGAIFLGSFFLVQISIILLTLNTPPSQSETLSFKN
jgi:ABC-type transport system involved in cytochrome c biogenesis permease subunit